MKLTLASGLVKRTITQLWTPTADVALCSQVVYDLCRDMPVIQADTIDLADKLVGDVMEWQKNFHKKSLNGKRLNRNEVGIVVGMLQTRFDAMHLELETLLYELGVVERGETDAPKEDTA